MLYGFSGHTDEKLSMSMAMALAHRCGAPTAHASTYGTLGWGRLEESPGGAGIAVDGERVAALAGFLTGRASGRTVHHILDAHHRRGVDALGELEGVFVLALMDRDRVHLVRDRAGARTLYYGVHGGRLRFACEPKGVLADSSFPRRLRPGAVAQYLTYSFVPGAGTMLEDLHELLPGHRLEWHSGTVRVVPLPPERIELPGRSGNWPAVLSSTIGDAVEDRRPAGQPVGAFLSGGIDSSIVVAELAARHDAPVRTYSIHFGPPHLNELPFAAAVAERCRTDHTEVLIRPRGFAPRLRQAIWHLDDPIGDPITVPNFELARRVSGDVSHVFNGEGGDPLFGGPKNLPMLLHHWYGGPGHGPGHRERAYLESYRRGYSELEQLLTPEILAGVDTERDLEGPLQPFLSGPGEPSMLHRLLRANTKLKGAHLILPKVDRMMAAHGLVPLSPLFDERLIALSLAMPPECKLRAGVEKVVLKEAYRGRLPREVVDRPKSGMRVPVRAWFRRELRRYARSVLSSKALAAAGIFRPERVAQWLRYDTEEHESRYGLWLWMLLTFELWRRIVLEGEAA
ncbi:MAG: asparagine synthase [Armatimonadia bacterium]|nr:asparagine synthase [Armatimonadia bacterium]